MPVINSISVRELEDEIVTMEESILAKNGWRAYGNNPHQARTNFLKVLNRTNREYDLLGSETHFYDFKTDGEGKCRFESNLELWHKGEITDPTQVMVIPFSVAYVKVKGSSSFIAADKWTYQRPLLVIPAYRNTTMQASISTSTTVFADINEDGEFTEESRVYFQDIHNVNYIWNVTLALLKFIKKRVTAIDVGQVRMFPEIDSVISEYQQLIENENSAELGLYASWRK